MSCNDGSLSTIREPLTPDPCGCECDGDDIAYVGQSSECTGVLPNEKLNSVLNKILTKICDMDAEITVSDIDWGCIPNAVAPTGGTVSSNIQFIADELIPRSGNDCNCAITDDLYFSDGKGIYQCPTAQDSGHLYFSGDYAYLNAETQIRATGDLKVSSGFGAAYSERNASTDLSVTPTESLRYSYGIDANANNVTLTLPEIGDASGDHLNRRLSIRRLDCNIGFTGTLQAAGSDTIEGLTSITVPIGHAFTIQADAATNDWVIMSEYFGCDTLSVMGDGDVFMTYNLGVGTNNASAKLHVINADTALVTAKLVNSGASAVDMLQVSINGTVKDVIDEAGRLHVGGSNPAAMIHATGSDNSSATFSLLAEGLAGEDFLWVNNGGGTVIRTGVDQRFSFGSGSLSAVNDANIIRAFSIQSGNITWNGNRHLTSNINLSPQSTSQAAYWTITATGTDSSGTNPIMVFDVNPTYNLSGTANGNVYGFRYRPTVTAVLGVHYAIVCESGLSGFNKATPLSHLESGGSVGYKTLTITGDTTLTVAHHHILADATTGAINVTLPSAASSAGREYFIKKIDAVANSVTITAADLLDGAGSKVISNQYAFYRIISDGATFWVTGNN
jgi:hypothetical protein